MPLYKQIPYFLDWWFTGLLYLLPESLRHKLRNKPDYALLEVQDDVLKVSFYQGGSDTLLQVRQARKHDKHERVALQNHLKTLQEGGGRLILLLPASTILEKLISLPAAASANLREVLSFEMDRQTPFSAEQVYFDFRIMDGAADADKIQLELFLVPKPGIDDMLLRLADWDIDVQAVSSKRDNALLADINLLPASELATANKNTLELNHLLAASCFLLFMIWLYLPLAYHEQKLEPLEAEVNRQRVAAKQLSTLNSEKAAMLKRTRFLSDKKQAAFASIDVLRELTLILPDDTWLSRLSLHDHEVQLQGESSTASAIIQTIENSEYFENVQFRSPVTRNNNTDKDRFNLSAQLSGRGNL